MCYDILNSLCKNLPRKKANKFCFNNNKKNTIGMAQLYRNRHNFDTRNKCLVRTMANRHGMPRIFLWVEMPSVKFCSNWARIHLALKGSEVI